MFDLVIRGATIVDGIGHDPLRAEIAVKDGRIAEIGEVRGAAAEVIDAGSDTSQAIATAPISSATALAALSERSRIATAAPSRRNSRAAARPIPEAPPVMMILRPANRAMVVSPV